jgi:hypothetical protein
LDLAKFWLWNQFQFFLNQHVILDFLVPNITYSKKTNFSSQKSPLLKMFGHKSLIKKKISNYRKVSFLKNFLEWEINFSNKVKNHYTLMYVEGPTSILILAGNTGFPGVDVIDQKMSIFLS